MSHPLFLATGGFLGGVDPWIFSFSFVTVAVTISAGA